MSTTLRSILAPESIAIIGASTTPTKRGHRAVQMLLREGYAGRIYPINPKASEILGVPCYKDLTEVPEAVDLAMVCTPARTVPQVIRTCGEQGVKGALVIAAGFSESGAEGKRLEQEMVAEGKRSGVRIIGPNTSGVFNTHRACNLVGVTDVKKGPLGILSQSGNMLLALVTEGHFDGHIGFSTYVGVGNQADIQLHEYLEAYADDEDTKAVVAYIEGLSDGAAFLDVARRVTQKKPVIVYKSGRTTTGQKAAKSHTGSLAGNFAVGRDVLRQSGVTLVTESDRLLPIAHALATQPASAGRRVAVLTDGGGQGTIAADALVEHGMKVGAPTAATRERLENMLTATAALANPIDVAGATDENPGLLAECAEVLLQDNEVDALFVVGMFGGYHLRFGERLAGAEEEAGRHLARLGSTYGKPIVMHSVYAPYRPAPLTVVGDAGVPVFGSIETAVKCVVALADYGDVRRRNASEELPLTRPTRRTGANLVARAAERGGNCLLEHEARDLLASYGIRLSPSLLVRNPSQLVDVPEKLGNGPMAMKVVSKDILHKTDAGGVKLGIQGPEAMKEAFAAIMSTAAKYDSSAVVEGVLVSPMVERGIELIFGVNKDPQFGPVMMFGMGGVFVEVLKDVAFRALPLRRADAEAILQDIKAAPVLAGTRGARPIDREAVIDLMLRLSELSLAHPEISEIDLNPVVVYPEGYAIVDARMLVTA
jgi:acetyltransferase